MFFNFDEQLDIPELESAHKTQNDRKSTPVAQITRMNKLKLKDESLQASPDSKKNNFKKSPKKSNISFMNKFQSPTSNEKKIQMQIRKRSLLFSKDKEIKVLYETKNDSPSNNSKKNRKEKISTISHNQDPKFFIEEGKKLLRKVLYFASFSHRI